MNTIKEFVFKHPVISFLVVAEAADMILKLGNGLFKTIMVCSAFRNRPVTVSNIEEKEETIDESAGDIN